MSSITAPASSRVNMRVSSATLEVIDEAASLQGVDRTSFVVDAAVSRARAVLLEERLRVTATEVEQIKRLLAEESPANPKLREAAQRLTQLGL